ncbi:RNA polymerase sigma factor [Peristeroidobacter soli]|uniref:RNA polymerase sigma factor n=1 Tax=Peristeroidobacter soli TaxID=2497877 RepID=UPI00101B9952|nr:sigma-70 family RNA polymerase sigma factor [Peristeroidobacter soli]
MDVQESVHREAVTEEHRARVEDLFRRYNKQLIGFLEIRWLSRQEAREVAQEAYVRLLSVDVRGVKSLESYLFKTAANIAIDRRRRDGLRERRAEELPVFSDLVDNRTPERRISGEQALLRLQHLISALPAKCQLAFVLNQIVGEDFQQVAERMGLSEDMVRKYVKRAWLHCRARIDQEVINAKR